MFWAPLPYWTLYKRYHFEYKGPVLISIIVSLITPISGLIAISLTEQKAEARILSYVFINCIIGSIFYFVNYRKDKTFFDCNLWKYAVSFNLPLLPCFLSETILNQSDRIMINTFRGSGEAAIYSIAFSAAQLVLLFSSALNAAFVPWQYRKLKEKDYMQMERVGYIVLLLLIGILAIVIMFAPEIIYVLAGPTYMGAVNLIPTLGASVFFNYMYQIFYRVEIYYEHKKQSVIATFVSSIVNIILNFMFIPKYGFVAAGYTTLIAHIILCIMHFMYYKRICHEEMDGILIYKTSKILGISILMLLISLSITLLYQSIAMRGVVLLILLFLLIAFYKNIINVVKHILG